MTSQFNLESYLQEGYLRLPGMVPAALLQRLRALFDQLMSGHESDGLTTTNAVNGRTFVNNVEKPVCRGNLSGLELMGFPPLLEIARTICGEDFFSLQDFGVVKMLGDNVPVLWHQDMVHQRTGRCFVMGVYLDDAGAGDGALKVVPRSHTSGRHICELQREASVDVPMLAGDILIHDMMLAHSSDPLTQRKMRRVLYLIFLSAAHVRAESLYPEEAIESRTGLLGLAIEHYRRLHPGADWFEWNNPMGSLFEDEDGGDLRGTLDELISRTIRPRPSAYCFEAG